MSWWIPPSGLNILVIAGPITVRHHLQVWLTALPCLDFFPELFSRNRFPFFNSRFPFPHLVDHVEAVQAKPAGVGLCLGLHSVATGTPDRQSRGADTGKGRADKGAVGFKVPEFRF